MNSIMLALLACSMVVAVLANKDGHHGTGKPDGHQGQQGEHGHHTRSPRSADQGHAGEEHKWTGPHGHFTGGPHHKWTGPQHHFTGGPIPAGVQHVDRAVRSADEGHHERPQWTGPQRHFTGVPHHEGGQDANRVARGVGDEHKWTGPHRHFTGGPNHKWTGPHHHFTGGPHHDRVARAADEGHQERPQWTGRPFEGGHPMFTGQPPVREHQRAARDAGQQGHGHAGGEHKFTHGPNGGHQGFGGHHRGHTSPAPK